MAELELGGVVDPASHERTGAPARIDSRDLTTHGVIVGMTGSGKTGLALVLVEEVLAGGVPVLLVDPKGDLGNLLLTFPDLAPADFRPWIDEAQAVRAGRDPDGFAADEAARWRDGLAGWGYGPEQVRALRDTAAMAIYTPGSTAGIPLNVVGSLDAPAGLDDPELLHDEIEGYVTGLLELVGVDADPLASREHILLTNLVADAWSRGQDLDLAGLVGMVPEPPVRKLGVFDLDTFFPPKDRMALAMRLNALLASPAFAAWSAGPPIDIEAMLRTPDGRPRAAIVSTAHLTDDERQFATSLLLTKLVTWMRRQSGTSELRALLYMDEVAGYVPPTAVPPTKKPIMLLMKQARAFGVGVVLATQNPVDVDYKALSNAGTWMIGRLQTERDKARLLDGMRAAAGAVDIDAVDATISGLGSREFVLKRAGRDRPEVFTTRWAMSYLRGPLTRDQIAALTEPWDGAAPDDLPPPPGGQAPLDLPPPPAGAAPVAPPAAVGAVAADVPDVASGVAVRWLDPAAPWARQVGAVAGSSRYAAAAVARVHLLFDETRADLRHEEEYEAVLFPLPATPDATGAIAVDYDDRDLRDESPPGATYDVPEAPIASSRYWTALQRSLADHLVRSRTVEVRVNRPLKVFGRVGETEAAFLARCQEAAHAGADAAMARLRTTYEPRLARAREAAAAAATVVQDADAARAAADEDGMLATVGDLVGGLFGGRRSGRSLARRATQRQQASTRAARNADTARTRHTARLEALEDLEHDLAADICEIETEFDAKATAVEVLTVPLEKSDVSVAGITLTWVPVG